MTAPISDDRLAEIRADLAETVAIEGVVFLAATEDLLGILSRLDKAEAVVRHLRAFEIIYSDGPDESDRHEADVHLSAAVLLSKKLVKWGHTGVTVRDARAVIAELLPPPPSSES